MTDINFLESNGFIQTYFLFLSGNESKTFNFENVLENIISIEVNSALIPRAEYTIENDYNKLIINDTEIILNERDYDVTDLITELNDKLSSLNIIIENQEGTGKLKFKSSSNFTINCSQSTCNRIIGLPNYDLTGQNEYLLPHRYNLMGTESILLESNYDSQINHGKLNQLSTPLAKFYVTDNARSQFIQVINHEQPSRSFHPISKMPNIQLSFLRAHDKLSYDFKGLNYYVHIIVKCAALGTNWNNLGTTKHQNNLIIDKLIHQIQQKPQDTSTKVESQHSNLKSLAILISLLGFGYFSYNFFKPQNNNIDV